MRQASHSCEGGASILSAIAAYLAYLGLKRRSHGLFACADVNSRAYRTAGFAFGPWGGSWARVAFGIIERNLELTTSATEGEGIDRSSLGRPRSTMLGSDLPILSRLRVQTFKEHWTRFSYHPASSVFPRARGHVSLAMINLRLPCQSLISISRGRPCRQGTSMGIPDSVSMATAMIMAVSPIQSWLRNGASVTDDTLEGLERPTPVPPSSAIIG